MEHISSFDSVSVLGIRPVHHVAPGSTEWLMNFVLPENRFIAVFPDGAGERFDRHGILSIGIDSVNGNSTHRAVHFDIVRMRYVCRRGITDACVFCRRAVFMPYRIFYRRRRGVHSGISGRRGGSATFFLAEMLVE